MKKVSQSRLNRYKVMRILFRTERDFDSILRETGLEKISLINVLVYLRHNRLIKEEMKGKTPIFFLTSRGENRLGYYEYVFQTYLRWSPVWAREGNWAELYFREMTEVIKKASFFVDNVG